MGVDAELNNRIEAVRRFNRFFTRQIGVLNEGLLDSPYTLAEVRVLYELAHRDAPTAGELSRELDLDAGYLSRILRRYQREQMLQRRKSTADARRVHLSLTPKGRATLADLNRRSQKQVMALLQALSADEQQQLVDAMARIQVLLSPSADPAVPYLLRPPRKGDMGWVIWRHNVLYQGEYGWNDRFIALVARAVAQFVENGDAARERCWIAVRDGRRVGSVFLCSESSEQARLRLLLVEPQARGLGIGRALVEQCVHTAADLGYQRMTLWTSSALHAARHIYESLGFKLAREQACAQFGADFIGQDWELDLSEIP